jgi:hypothetical protein
MKVKFPPGSDLLIVVVGMSILSAIMFQKNTMPLVHMKEQADAAECRSRGIPLSDCARTLRSLERSRRSP